MNKRIKYSQRYCLIRSMSRKLYKVFKVITINSMNVVCVKNI